MGDFEKVLDGKEEAEQNRKRSSRASSPHVSSKKPKIASISHGTLTDSRLWSLSKEITTQKDLRTLGINGLKLSHSVIQTALTDNPGDINSAAHTVLQKWFQKYKNGEDALRDLQSVLHESGMSNLASQLVTGFGDECQERQMSKQRVEDIKRWTKKSFTTPPFCRSFGLDWTPPPRNPAPDLEEVHTNVRWTRKHRKAYTVEQEDLENITKILNEEELGESGPVRILVQGKGGIGKSIAMKYLALIWAKGSDEDLKNIDFLFHISLKCVRDNSNIEDIVFAQHSGLHSNKVKPAEIKAILEGETKGKVLIIFDGHDEYKRGRNNNIDKAIEKKKLWNCWMIVTSRESEQIKHVKEYMDAEAEIHGFDAENIKKYLTKSLGSNEKCDELWTEVMERGLIKENDLGELEYNIVDIPLFLHMVCSLFGSNQTLPETRTKIIEAIVCLYIEREAIREREQKADINVEECLINLGKLAWQGLNDPRGPRLAFSRKEIEQLIGKDVFMKDVFIKSGLLVSVEGRTGEGENFTFHHLLFQQFFAGKFLTSLKKKSWEKLFPSSKEVIQHQETLVFACGVMDQPEPLVEVICDRLASVYRQLGYLISNPIEGHIRNIESKYLLLYDILVAIEKVIRKSCTVHPLHNMVINYMSNRQDTLFVPSKYYIFHRPPKTVKYVQDTSVPRNDLGPVECSVVTDNPDVFEVIFKLGKITQIHITHLIVDTNIRDDNFLRYSFDSEKAMKKHHHLNERLKKFLGESGDLCSRSATQVAQSDEKFQAHWKEHISLSENAQIIIIQNSPPLVKHVTPQLVYCKQLQVLCLTDTDVPQELGVALPVMKDLKSLYFQRCIIEPNLFKTIVEQLSVCEKLEVLSLDKTLNVPIEIGKTLTQLTSLRRFNVWDCKMSGAVSEALMQGLTRCPEIENLNLIGNTLTGLLDNLLSDSIRHKLCHLYVANTGLSESDVRSVAMAARENKLPNLRTLNISGNTLTGLVGALMDGTDHPGYTSIEVLEMVCISVSKDDMNCLSQAVTAGKLPRLRYLTLLYSKLYLMTEEVEHFVRSCVECYSQQRVTLMLGLNKLTDTFVEQLKSIVQGTHIKLTFSKTTEEAKQALSQLKLF